MIVGAHASACRPLWAFVFLCLIGVGWLHAQDTGPLRKTDLVRLLTANTQTLPQIVARVQRSCVSFTPTARDRTDLVALGGDTTLLKAIDTCVRNRVITPAPTTVATARTPGSTGRPPVRPPARPAVRPAAVDTTPAPPPPPPRLLAVPLASRVSVPAGGTASVSVALKRGTDAVPGARLVLRGSARVAGSDSDIQAVTDGRGIAQFRFPVGTNTGTTRLSVGTIGGDTLDAAADFELSVVRSSASSAPSASSARPPDRPAAPAAPAGPPAADRTGFISGANQRGTVGENAAQPLVYEVRDGNGRLLGGVGVSFTVTNGQIVGTASNLTDSLGRARVRVQFGERAQVPTVVTGTIGDIVHDATLLPVAGAPTNLVVLLSGNTLIGEIVLLGGHPSELRIYGRDKFGNVAPLTGLRATATDERIVRVTAVTSDSSGGSVTLTAGRGGSTGVVIEGSGLRADFTAQVHP